MPGPSREITLVTPVWNDASRLAVFGASLAEALADSPLPVRWVIGDDGSSHESRERLSTLRDRFAETFPHVEIMLADAHHGKGSVVRESWQVDPEADWLAFVDADGSLAPDGLLGLISAAIDADCSVIAIRKRTDSATFTETPWRALAHRLFLLAVRLLLGLRCQDPQCGAKVLKGPDYRRIAPLLVENGLAFDSELLTALHTNGAKWIEIPVNWYEKGGGKVRPTRDAFPMLAALFRIRKRLRAGEFQRCTAVPPASRP
jgi:glycosyltransferase involved in cell wall biosynthesis